MKIFHKHQWKEIARTYAGPNLSLKKFYPTPLFEKLFHGVTTIMWECKECGNLKKEEMLGAIIKPISQ